MCLSGNGKALLMRCDGEAGEGGGWWDTEGSVACGVANQVYALDAASGVKLWEFETGRDVNSLPAVVDGTVVVESGAAGVSVADPPGWLTEARVTTRMRL
jgi:outer membrane protein assembly factor BamB